MEKVPQIVTERLRAASALVTHPDADTLTAFAERTLSKAERASVVSHLGICSECREIIALALPMAEPDQQVLRTTASAWMTWPVLRWGVIAAGIMVVGSFGFLEYQHRHESSATVVSKAQQTFDKEAKNVVPAAPAQTGNPADKSAPPSEPSQQPAPGTASGPSGIAAAPSSSPAFLRIQPPANARQHGPHVQLQQNANTYQNQTVASTGATPPTRQDAGEVAGNLPASAAPLPNRLSDTSAQNETASLDARAAPLGAQSDLRQLDSRVERSKPASPSAKTTPHALASGRVLGEETRAKVESVNPSSSVQWNIGSSGELERSSDQGHTWEKVDVSTTSGFDSFAALHGEKDAVRDLTMKKQVMAPVFRAVASNGPDVWAGASGGLLYHSTDAGLHWTRVVPASSSARLTGDIVSLDFPDSQHGRIVTAAPEVWTTTDGGQSWQKQ